MTKMEKKVKRIGKNQNLVLVLPEKIKKKMDQVERIIDQENQDRLLHHLRQDLLHPKENRKEDPDQKRNQNEKKRGKDLFPQSRK